MNQLKEFLGYSPLNLFVPAILFILLSPGMIMTFPPNTVEKRWFTEETSRCAIITHALLFVIVYYFIRKYFAQYY